MENNICKNCKHYEYAAGEFGFCHFLEENTIRNYTDFLDGKRKEREDPVTEEEKIQIRLNIIYRPTSDVLNINGVKYILDPEHENLSGDDDENADHSILYYVHENFGCKAFEKE